MDSIFEIKMSYFYAGAFIAGVSSFAHCFLMCGPINLLFRNHAFSYQAGRIFGYTLLGAVLGSIGPALDRAGILVSVQNISIYIAAFFLLAYGTIILFQIKLKTPAFFKKLSGWIIYIKKIPYLPLQVSTGLAGVLSALIPCSVLYPVWILASSSGSMLNGSVMAFSFVLGTVPALWAFQMFSRGDKFLPFFRNKIFRNLSTVIVVCISIFILYHRYTNAPGSGQTDSGNEICE